MSGACVATVYLGCLGPLTVCLAVTLFRAYLRASMLVLYVFLFLCVNILYTSLSYCFQNILLETYGCTLFKITNFFILLSIIFGIVSVLLHIHCISANCISLLVLFEMNICNVNSFEYALIILHESSWNKKETSCSLLVVLLSTLSMFLRLVDIDDKDFDGYQVIQPWVHVPLNCMSIHVLPELYMALWWQLVMSAGGGGGLHRGLCYYNQGAKNWGRY